MNVRQIIESLIGLNPDTEVEITDTDGNATSLTGIKHHYSNGSLYIEAQIDERTIITDRG